MSKPIGTYDLVERLRELNDDSFVETMHGTAADRIEELEAKLADLEKWRAAAFIAHSNLDLDIEADPQALAELSKERSDEKGQDDE